MSNKRSKRTTINRSLADKFTQKLEQLPPKKKTELTPKELIAENSMQLDSLLEKGYTYDDLVALLKEEGIQLSRVTLRQYLSESRKNRDAPQAHKQQPLPDTPNNEPSAPLAPEPQRQTQRTRTAKKLGKGRLQSDENSARYPSGNGQPIEMNETP